MALSPAQAAQRVGVSRSKISRALTGGELRGVRDNRGHWRIEPDAVDAWAATHCANTPAHRAHTAHEQSKTVQATTVSTFKDKLESDALELATTKAENGQLRERLADLENERERERGQFRERMADLERDRNEWRDMAKTKADQPRLRWPWSRS